MLELMEPAIRTSASSPVVPSRWQAHGLIDPPPRYRRMARLIGPARTRLILMAGQKISAEEALTFGLVDRIVEGDALMDTARGLTTDVCAATPEIAHAIGRMCDG